MREIQQFCRNQRDWLIETIEALVALESPTLDKAAVDACGRELAHRLEAIGATVTRLPRQDRGDHLVAAFGSGGAQVLLLGHFDTVWPVGQLARMPIRHSDGRLYGPGVFDMKTGIALGMLATRALLESEGGSRRKIVMLWTTDEEIGSESSRADIEEIAGRSAAVLVLEPSLPGGVLKTARKGCGQYQLTVHGVAAHAGIDPSQGASAILELARQICALNTLVPRLSAGVSLNAGLITGGSRANVVADTAAAIIDVRATTNGDMEAVDRALRAIEPTDPRTRLVWSGGFDRPPLERTEGVARLYDQARKVAGQLGLTVSEGSTGGGSDGNFTAALGVPTLDGLGAIGDGAHALHEHVEIAPLADRAALIAGLIRSI